MRGSTVTSVHITLSIFDMLFYNYLIINLNSFKNPVEWGRVLIWYSGCHKRIPRRETAGFFVLSNATPHYFLLNRRKNSGFSKELLGSWHHFTLCWKYRKLWKNQNHNNYFIVFDYFCPKHLFIPPNEKKDYRRFDLMEKQSGTQAPDPSRCPSSGQVLHSWAVRATTL